MKIFDIAKTSFELAVTRLNNLGSVSFFKVEVEKQFVLLTVLDAESLAIKDVLKLTHSQARDVIRGTFQVDSPKDDLVFFTELDSAKIDQLKRAMAASYAQDHYDIFSEKVVEFGLTDGFPKENDKVEKMLGGTN